MKENKKTMVLTTLVCLIPVIAGMILYPDLPDKIVIHWDANGTPNGWAGKFMGAIGLPGILLLLNIVMPFLTRMDPKYRNVNQTLLKITYWVIPAVSVVCSVFTLSYAKGMDLKVERFMPALLGVLFIVIGNYLPKTKQSYTMGIKLPWTLHSEENWNRTHRLAGFLWVAGGIVCIVCALFDGSFPIIMGVLLAAALLPAGYSFALYKKGI